MLDVLCPLCLSHRLSLVHLPTAHLSMADIDLRRILEQQAVIVIKPASMIVASTTAMHVLKLTSMTCRQIETDITRKESLQSISCCVKSHAHSSQQSNRATNL